MKLIVSSTRSAMWSLMGAAFLAACGGSTSAPTSTQSSVDGAYAALVSDVANCAKQVKTCVDAAGTDSAALDACRTQFASCRDAAGADAQNALADAVRTCTSAQNACVKSAAHGDAGSCSDDLNVCLRAAHPKSSHDDDSDAGSDEGKPEQGDCLDQLHTCVAASGSPSTCAESVRKCVVDCVPGADAVVPPRSDDHGGDGSKGGDADDRGKPAQAGSSGSVRADAGVPEQENAGRMCVDKLSTCVDSGGDLRACAQQLKDCVAPPAP